MENGNGGVELGKGGQGCFVLLLGEHECVCVCVCVGVGERRRSRRKERKERKGMVNGLGCCGDMVMNEERKRVGESLIG